MVFYLSFIVNKASIVVDYKKGLFKGKQQVILIR
jgi:hypothetical protein